MGTVIGPRILNPHREPSIAVTEMVATHWRHRRLIAQMVRREVLGRYAGSLGGVYWSLVNPILMLAVYTFVFSVVFKARWGGADESRTMFALVLFAGLIVHGIFAEVLNRAPGLIVANVNYVKKVVFPLEVLPGIAMGAALLHAAISFGVLAIAVLLLQGQLHATLLLLPIVLLPLAVLALGVAWGLASLGVFVRDIGQIVTLLTTVLLFLSPVFYPVTALPEHLRPFMMLNPLTLVIEQVRAVTIWGTIPDWRAWSIYSVAALGVAWIGFAWFQRTRKGFADVL